MKHRITRNAPSHFRSSSTWITFLIFLTGTSCFPASLPDLKSNSKWNSLHNLTGDFIKAEGELREAFPRVKSFSKIPKDSLMKLIALGFQHTILIRLCFDLSNPNNGTLTPPEGISASRSNGTGVVVATNLQGEPAISLSVAHAFSTKPSTQGMKVGKCPTERYLLQEQSFQKKTVTDQLEVHFLRRNFLEDFSLVIHSSTIDDELELVLPIAEKSNLVGSETEGIDVLQFGYNGFLSTARNERSDHHKESFRQIVSSASVQESIKDGSCSKETILQKECLELVEKFIETALREYEHSDSFSVSSVKIAEPHMMAGSMQWATKTTAVTNADNSPGASGGPVFSLHNSNLVGLISRGLEVSTPRAKQDFFGQIQETGNENDWLQLSGVVPTVTMHQRVDKELISQYCQELQELSNSKSLQRACQFLTSDSSTLPEAVQQVQEEFENIEKKGQQYQ